MNDNTRIRIAVPAHLYEAVKKQLTLKEAKQNFGAGFTPVKEKKNTDGAKPKVEGAKDAKTPKQKQTVKKSIEIQEGKLGEASENIATTTSRVNYIDSRIIVSWCKKHDVSIEKIYNKNLLKKFTWAMDTPPNWRF
jgi:DNA topoisomerase-1